MRYLTDKIKTGLMIFGAASSIVCFTGCNNGDKNSLSGPISDNRYHFGAIDSMYIAKAGDGSTILARDTDVGFFFYRDSDNDGYFDTFGIGFRDSNNKKIIKEERDASDLHCSIDEIILMKP